MTTTTIRSTHSEWNEAGELLIPLAAGQFFLGLLPDVGVLRTKKQHVIVSCRVGAVTDEDARVARHVVTHVERVESRLLRGRQMMLRLRHVWLDNAHTSAYTASVDLLHDRRQPPSPELVGEIEIALRAAEWMCGQSPVESVVRTLAEDFGSDYFYPINAKYYDDIPQLRSRAAS